ncbi:hypothetical protein, partial [uncultured Selenomonas sp.]|uniref:hypothetical protein n=1 Tax=uncultured Selenomonas sp. TaxID=159275 RepID=UPI0028DC0DC0
RQHVVAIENLILFPCLFVENNLLVKHFEKPLFRFPIFSFHRLHGDALRESRRNLPHGLSPPFLC